MNAVKMIRAGLTFVAMLGMLLGALMSGVSAQGMGGNEYCPDTLLPLDGDQVNTADGIFEYQTPNGVVTFWLLDDKGLMFTSTVGVDAVVVKGGNDAFTYTFDEAFSGGPLYAPINASGGPAGVSNVRFCYDVDPVILWCSPGFWKNNTSLWSEADQTTPYASIFDTLEYKVKGVTYPYTDANANLLFVLQHPEIFGGGTANQVADYLSELYLGEDYTGMPTSTETHDCPLDGDGN